jgi:DNA replication protein DnaC
MRLLRLWRLNMNDNIEQLCNLLRLKRIPKILDRHLKLAQKDTPGYSDFLAALLREEFHDQRERATEGRIRRARLPEMWSLDSFPWDRQPGVDKRAIRELAELDFVRSGTNLVFRGETGVGKTGLATGLLLRALQDGYRGYFLKAQDLFDELYNSLADRSSRKLLDRLIRLDVLLIDEMGYLNLRPEQTNMFFKLMEERYVERRTSIITTNLDYDQWRRFLGNEHLTSALLSRIRHRCITITIDGPSLRSPSEQS